MLLGQLALIVAALFTGAALYVNAVQVRPTSHCPTSFKFYPRTSYNFLVLVGQMPFTISDIRHEYEIQTGRKVGMPDVIQCLQSHGARSIGQRYVNKQRPVVAIRSGVTQVGQRWDGQKSSILIENPPNYPTIASVPLKLENYN